MDDYERLKRLAERGDDAAAKRLEAEAARRDDAAGQIVAAGTLADGEGLLDLLADACATERWQEATATAAALGFALDRDLADGLARRLSETFLASLVTYRGRKASTETLRATQPHLGDLLRLVFESLRHPDGVAFVVGDYHRDMDNLVVCLAVRRDDAVVLGIGSADRRRPSVGTAWPDELRPWRKRLASNLDRVRAWAAAPGDDRVALQRVGSARGIEAKIEAEHADAGPLSELRTLLAEPSVEHWKTIRSMLHAWPDTNTLDDAIALAERMLDDAWPDRMREGDTRWWRSYTAKKKPKRYLHLIRRAVVRTEAFDRYVATATDLRELQLWHDALYIEQDGAGPGVLETFLAAPTTPKLRALGTELRRRDLLERLWRAPELSGLERLILGLGDLSFTAADFAAPAFRALRHLGIDCWGYGGRSAPRTALPAVAELGALEVLDLPGYRPSAEALRGLDDAAYASSLRLLSLQGCELEVAHVAALCAADTSITHLDLSSNPLGAEGMAVLASWPGLARVTHLGLAHTQLGEEGVDVLLESPHLSALRFLDLRTNGTRRFPPASLRKLVSAKPLAGLKTLWLGDKQRTKRALAKVTEPLPDGVVRVDDALCECASNKHRVALRCQICPLFRGRTYRNPVATR